MQVSLNADGTIRARRRGAVGGRACAVRVDAAEKLLTGQKPSAELIRAVQRRVERSAPQADLRGTVDYKKHLAGALLRGVCVRRSRVWEQA